MSAGQLGGGSEFISQLHSFVELEIKPKIKKIESFFESIGIKLKLQELNVSSFKDDTTAITALLDRGVISPKEAKDLLNYSTG
jgi:alcohol dehydrogenase YqhD (iron-dependent ADH family)